MSIFHEVDTLCIRESNKCRQRNKCLRYLSPRTSTQWEADFFSEYGRFCHGFIEVCETENKTK